MKSYFTALTLTATAAVALAGCGADKSEAYQMCERQLISTYGEDGVVKIFDVTENESTALMKVEGSLVYREQQGAGDRVDTWFICQLEKTSGGGLAVRELTVK